MIIIMAIIIINNNENNNHDNKNNVYKWSSHHPMNVVVIAESQRNEPLRYTGYHKLHVKSLVDRHWLWCSSEQFKRSQVYHISSHTNEILIIHKFDSHVALDK